MKRLAIITTHPIQYHSPLFRLLQERNRVSIRVFYTHGAGTLEARRDDGFGKVFKWDIPLTDGYDHEFLEVKSARNVFRPQSRLIDAPKLVDRVRSWGADAILVYGWNIPSHLRAMRYFKGKMPVYFRGDSTLLDDAASHAPRKLARSLFLRWVYRHVDAALYVGTNNKAYYEAFGLHETQLVYVPHAVENARFAEPRDDYERQATQWRQQIGIDSNHLVFLYAAKFEPKKDPLTLLNAFNKINRPGAHLIFVGNGILEDELRRLAANVERVHFLGFQNQSRMPVVYRLGDVFVLPSQGPGETWGLAINEAMACGRAVIASDRCGCAIDLIDAGQNGFVFPHRDINELASKMAWFCDNPAAARRMGDASRLRIAGWSFEKICDAIESLVNAPSS